MALFFVSMIGYSSNQSRVLFSFFLSKDVTALSYIDDLVCCHEEFTCMLSMSMLFRAVKAAIKVCTQLSDCMLFVLMRGIAFVFLVWNFLGINFSFVYLFHWQNIHLTLIFAFLTYIHKIASKSLRDPVHWSVELLNISLNQAIKYVDIYFNFISFWFEPLNVF